MNKIVYSLLIFYLFSFDSLLAQDESLVPLKSNPVLINEWKRINSQGVNQNERTQSATTDTLLLPFIDDFSSQYMFPRPDLWKDSAVFINADFPINPPTIGVATFDGLNRFGNPYVAVTTSDGWCDTLTSQPINAYDDGQGNPYDTAAGLFLSFFYEQKGFGDRPEQGTNPDHLDLEFFNPVLNAWSSSPIWTVSATGAGAADTTFTRVQITITNANYFHKGFRFRFRNWGSRTGNIDHWHIDYVTLKAPPNDPNINDVAYVTPGHSLLAGMTAMPYTHFTTGQVAPSGLMRDSVKCKMFNNNNSLDKICRFVDRIFDPSGTEIFCNGCPVGSNNFQVDHQGSLNYNFPFDSFTFLSLPQATAAFDVVNNIESTSATQLDDNPNNDTIHYLQKFYNYYSYDDGTAELGYNLNVAGAQLALKFHLYKADVLHAVQFYFTQIGPSVTSQLFDIRLWDATGVGGTPGNTICQKINQVPAYSNIIDGFVTYNFSSLCTSITLPPGDYYIGFVQAGSTGLNLGFDANIVTPSSLKYFNTNGTWTQSTFAGSWMIRPVFSPYPFNVGENEIDPLSAASIYPNPASEVIHVEYDVKGKTLHYELYDASGRIVAQNKLSNNTIDIQNISDGFYVLRITDGEKKNIFQQKVIIHH